MKLDAYEYVSVAIPGAVMLFICMLLFPELREILGKDGIQLGGLGLILILSLAVGQLVQAVGNFVRWLDYTIGSDPSSKLLSEKQVILESGQWIRLKHALKDHLNVDLESLSPSNWSSVRQEMRTFIKEESATDRLSAFTRNASLARGIIAACLLAIPLTYLSKMGQVDKNIFAAVFAICAILACFRMRRANGFYLINLVLHFLRSIDDRHVNL